MLSKTKKEILGLIFKKISFRGGAPACRTGRQNEKISPSLYEPFQKLLSDDKIHGISRKEAKNCAPISSKPMDELWASVYHKLKIVLEFVFKEDLE